MKIHHDLLIAQHHAYTPAGLHITNVLHEAESKDYGACSFELNQHRAQFRIGKITPTKIGQFTTLWKRIGAGPIMPYDVNDPIDLFIISVRKEERLGQFIFPKDILSEKGFLSHNGKGGKRAMRIYPPWDIPNNKQAINTQRWQLNYFFEIKQNNLDIMRIYKLFN